MKTIDESRAPETEQALQGDRPRLLAEGKMSWYQIGAILLCQLINMFDGFDVVVASYTAPAIGAEWQVAPERLGLFISASLFGMTAGSLFLAPMADRVGRRPTVLLGLAIITAGMLLSSGAASLGWLVALRVVTGLGIGILFASLTTMVAEYSTDQRRDLAVTFLHLGYPVGATVGGLLAAWILSVTGDWRPVYLAGGAGTALLILLVFLRLPESLDFLLDRQPPGALDKVNRQLTRMGRAPLTALPRQHAPGTARAGVRTIVSGDLARRTFYLWAAFFTSLLVVYFLIGWTPQILVLSGLSEQKAIVGGVILNAGGGCGMLLLGFLAKQFRLERLIALYFVVAALFMIGFALVSADVSLTILFALTFAMGFFSFGSLIGLYALATRVYPTEVRTTGVGWAIGIGRMGSIVGPSLAGLLIGLEWDRGTYYFLFALPLLVGAMAALKVGATRGQTGEAG
ncbi:4-hydroxybenzoate transporter PcaK [Tsuneonella dongtanensis]|uniref:4-hydroxybenzoate transporter PcaK n=1 Tax=Tsuneonella dongtanensis TaxID=692370 RepID=A0A1B2ABP8_9SPHN|nr:MFS transporter [Tsuneonella dongtanensis]ANY19589.1 4-hydroxybenzoate transporter PcaK [Tsuneonella dongtanensis]